MLLLLKINVLRTPNEKSCDIGNIRNKTKNENKTKTKKRNAMQNTKKLINMDLPKNRR